MRINYRLEDIKEAALRIIEATSDHDIIAFDAPMGAGKTTLIAEICRCLGADDDFGSPTFSIVNEYADREGRPIYHFDFYRIEKPQEALDMGAEEYFYSGNLCLLEWPEKIGSILPEEALRIKIEINPDESRTLYIGDAED